MKTEKEIHEDLLKGEKIDLECKEAESQIPKSIYETYSAFANTNGGTILLGIREDRKAADPAKRFTVTGIKDKDKLLADFWNTINSSKVNANILLDEHVYPIELPTPDGDEICTPYLAALVRLADEIDVTASRNPKMLYDIDAITDEKQHREHLRHRAIHDMIISRDAFTLYYDDSNESINDMIKTLVEKMNRTLNNCRRAVNGRTIFEITQREVLAVPLR